MTYSYMVVRKTTTPPHQCGELKAVLDFITFSIDYVTPNVSALYNGYATLPNNIVALVKSKLSEFQCDGKFIYDAYLPPAPNPPTFGYTSQYVFDGLTPVPYVPFYNYLGEIIPANEAQPYQLTTLGSVYGNKNNYHASSSLKLTNSIIVLLPLILIFLVS